MQCSMPTAASPEGLSSSGTCHAGPRQLLQNMPSMYTDLNALKEINAQGPLMLVEQNPYFPSLGDDSARGDGLSWLDEEGLMQVVGMAAIPPDKLPGWKKQRRSSGNAPDALPPTPPWPAVVGSLVGLMLLTMAGVGIYIYRQWQEKRHVQHISALAGQMEITGFEDVPELRASNNKGAGLTGLGRSRPNSQQQQLEGGKPATAGASAIGSKPPATTDGVGRSLSASRLGSGRSVADISLEMDPETSTFHRSGRSSRRATRPRVTKEQAYNAWFQPTLEGAEPSTQPTTSQQAPPGGSSSSSKPLGGSSSSGDQPLPEQGQLAAGPAASREQQGVRSAGSSASSSRRVTRALSHSSSSRGSGSHRTSAAHHHHHHHHSSSSSKDMVLQTEQQALSKQQSTGASIRSAGNAAARSQEQPGTSTGNSHNTSSPAQGVAPGVAPARVTSSHTLGEVAHASQQQPPASTQPPGMGGPMHRSHSLAQGHAKPDRGPSNPAENRGKSVQQGQHDGATQQAQHIRVGLQAQHAAAAAQQAQHAATVHNPQVQISKGHLHPQPPAAGPAGASGARLLPAQWPPNRSASAALRHAPHLLDVHTTHAQQLPVHLPGYAPTPTGDMRKGPPKW